MDRIAAILASALSMAAPLIYASVGEILSERSGTLNLGLEGVMLMGAVMGYRTAYVTHSLTLALLAALGTGALLGLLFAFLTVTLQANQVVSGLALVILGTGASGFIGYSVTGTTLPHGFQKIAIPVLSKIPVLGTVLFRQNAMIYLLYILVPAITVYIYKTNPGLRLRALGEDPGTLDAAGLNVYAMKYAYTTVGMAIVALGGAYMTLAYTSTWIENITAGNGWIASALVIFAFWNPALAALGSVFFGLVSVLALRVQISNTQIPSFFISMLPYICTVLVLLISSSGFSRKLGAAPRSLGTYYDREER